MARRPGIFKRAPTSSASGVALLLKCSKAALVDLCIDLIAMDGNASVDDEVTAERVRPHLATVLDRRGDRMPKSETA